MRVAIIGSRTITYIDVSAYLPEGVSEIISGGAKGIDTLAEQYADAHRLSKHIMRPNYAKYGRGAPLVRNREMVTMAEQVIVFWDGISRGTQWTIAYMQKHDIPHCVHIIEPRQ